MQPISITLKLDESKLQRIVSGGQVLYQAKVELVINLTLEGNGEQLEMPIPVETPPAPSRYGNGASPPIGTNVKLTPFSGH